MSIQNRSNISRIFLFSSIFVFAFILLYINRSKITTVVTPFAIGILITYILEPAVRYLMNKGLRRRTAVGIIFFILIGVLLLSLFYVIPVLFEEADNLIEIIPDYIKYIRNKAADFNLKYKRTFPLEIQQVADQNIIQIKDSIYKKFDNLYDSIKNMFAGLLSIILGPILGFYILKDIDIIKKSIAEYIPVKYRHNVMLWLVTIDNTLGLYVRSQLAISVIIALFTSIAMLILKIDFALLIGLVAGIANIIPYFGPLIGSLPAVAIATLKYPHKIPWIIVSTIIIHEVESGIVSPYVLGETVGLHPLTVIFSLLMGGAFFGPWGLVFAVPAAVIIKLSISGQAHRQ